MVSSNDITNLLRVLKRLYFRIMALQNESRAKHSHNEGNKASPRNIEQPLSDCIDKLASVAVSKPLDSTELHISKVEITTHNHTDITRDPDSWTELGELSLHLKESHKYSGVSQDTGSRLILSTWEHLHTSIRYARQGNTHAARVHMNLTNSALNEAAHYLPEQVYSRFTKEVIQAIEEIANKI